MRVRWEIRVKRRVKFETMRFGLEVETRVGTELGMEVSHLLRLRRPAGHADE